MSAYQYLRLGETFTLNEFLAEEPIEAGCVLGSHPTYSPTRYEVSLWEERLYPTDDGWGYGMIYLGEDGYYHMPILEYGHVIDDQNADLPEHLVAMWLETLH